MSFVILIDATLPAFSLSGQSFSRVRAFYCFSVSVNLPYYSFNSFIGDFGVCRTSLQGLALAYRDSH